MKEKPKSKKEKKRFIILGFALAIAITAAIVFFQFSSFGYRMSVPFRSFIQAAPHVYVSKNYSSDVEEALRTVGEARQRVLGFFKELRSVPTIILCDDSQTLRKLGGDHDTQTTAFLNVFSYIAISPDYLNVDIVAHEITHAEVHQRVFHGKIGYPALIPTWFDEGVALQNDYREGYGESAWEEVTHGGESAADLHDIDTAAKFYAGEPQERLNRYILSKHELGGWIERKGIDTLIRLLDDVNQGMDFNELYFTD